MRAGGTVRIYSHHLVVGAVDARSCIGQHLCSDTGEDRSQLHVEPLQPVCSFKQREVRADDDEGPIHHDISHGWLDVRYLCKHNMRGREIVTPLHDGIWPTFSASSQSAFPLCFSVDQQGEGVAVSQVHGLNAWI